VCGFQEGGPYIVTQLLTFSADKQPTRVKNSGLQDATDLQQITANEASGVGSLPGLERGTLQKQQICNIWFMGNKGYDYRCFTK
jgi:hypothetical protein